MDLGSEITTRLKSSIKTKLQELGSYIDDELPEYILVMISNKRSPSQMKDDLSLFLGDETEKFVSWVFAVLAKLQEATDPADVPLNQDEGNAETVTDTKKEEEAEVKMSDKTKRKPSSSDNEKNRAEKESLPNTECTKPISQSNKVSKAEETKKATSRKEVNKRKERKEKDVSEKEQVKKQAGQKRHLSSEDEDEASVSSNTVASKVEIQKKQARPSLPVSRQASGNLIKRAMEEARKSVNKPGFVASHEYSLDNCDSVVWIQDPELREQQKQVLLRQHRELEELRNIKDQLKKQKAIIDQSLSPEAERLSKENEREEKINEADIDVKDGIELEVDDNEFVDEWIEVNSSPKDRRVIAISGDKTAEDVKNEVKVDKGTPINAENNVDGGGIDAEITGESKDTSNNRDERKDREVRRDIKDTLSRSSRDRHSRRRHTRHRDSDKHHDRKQATEVNMENFGNGEGLLSPKFVVTLNGLDSDYEKKFEDEHRRERRKRKFTEKHQSNNSDTLFINLDKRTNNLKPLEIMQQALLTIQQPIVPGQMPLVPPNFDLLNQTLPLPKPQTDLFNTFDLRNQLLPPPNNVGSLIPSAAAKSVNLNQPMASQAMLPNRLNQNTTRNLTNLVPLTYTPNANAKDSDESKVSDGKTTPKLENTEYQNVPSVEQVRIRLDSESADDEETEMETETILERCKFWPECKNGISCSYVHPTVPCKSFPKCSYSDKCIFLHPVCKFDGRCTNVSCPYTHTSKQKMYGGSGMPQSTTGSSDPNAPLCRFYPNCSKKFCPFRHPIGKPCRYGSGCTRTDCLFAHETKPAGRGALTWTAGSKDQKPALRNRKFACPEANVTAVPVSVST